MRTFRIGLTIAAEPPSLLWHAPGPSPGFLRKQTSPARERGPALYPPWGALDIGERPPRRGGGKGCVAPIHPFPPAQPKETTHAGPSRSPCRARTPPPRLDA